MLKSMKIITLIAYSMRATVSAETVQTKLYPSHDAFIRKDNMNKLHGYGSKITVTKYGANQRIGLMKFDTAEYDEENFIENDVKAHLRIGIAETHASTPVTVKVMRLDSDFDEKLVSWHNFDGDADNDFVEFTVEQDHVNKMGQVDISKLLKAGKDTVLVFVIEDEGYVKFHSKEHKLRQMSPSLILSYDEL